MTPTTVTEFVRTKRSTSESTFTVPPLSPHIHKKKPKYTHDPADEQPDFESFDRTRLSVCNTTPFALPLSHQSYLTMSKHYKSLFVKVNYYNVFVDTTVLNKVINDYRRFSYLFDNCHMFDSQRMIIGEVIINDVNKAEV